MRHSLHVVLFLVRPGDGKEFVYSPVGVNVTLHCAVNNTNLVWDVDGLASDSAVQGPELHTRGIFWSEQLSSNGIIASSVTVFGNQELTRICCQSFANGHKENCTILIVYGKLTTIICEKIKFR